MNFQQQRELSLKVIKQTFSDSIAIKNNILLDDKQLDILINMAQIIAIAIKQGGKLLLCGNGGSASDAQHLATELVVRLRSKVNRQSLPAISLAMDSSMLTAIGNDYSFEQIFARPLSSLGAAGDVLLGISTSGNSPNILRALELAKKMNIKTLGFLGNLGGLAINLCDYAFIVPSKITARIQEIHIMVGHIVMELIEEQLIAESFIATKMHDIIN